MIEEFSYHLDVNLSPKPVLITDFIGDPITLDDVGFTQIFFEPQARYLYSPIHKDDSSLIVCAIIGFAEFDDHARVIIPGSKYYLPKDSEGYLISDPVRFNSLIWKYHYDHQMGDLLKKLQGKLEYYLGQIEILQEFQTEAIQRFNVMTEIIESTQKRIDQLIEEPQSDG